MPKFFSLNGMFDSSNSVLAERKVKSCSKDINDNLNMYINDHLRMYTSDYALI